MVAEGFPTRGATEKDLIEDPQTGAQYVAKLGRRNNDLEVVTEYLIYLVGRNPPCQRRVRQSLLET
jgi:hypothetical protein